MTTPPRFSGGWQRGWVRVDGGARRSAAHVIWLQAGDRFADVRTGPADEPLAGPGAFAGTTSFDGRRLTWHHHIDVPRPDSHASSADVGEIEWFDDHTIIERGSYLSGEPGRRVAYEECWVRLADAVGEQQVLTPTAGAGVAVLSGRHLVGLRDADPDDDGRQWAAVHLRRDGDAWTTEAAIGPDERSRRLVASLLRALDPDAAPDSPATKEWKINEPINALSS